ncbi:TolB amino-terminal domain-containing protein [Cribrihabitans marinus]|uniref:TolB amino-terminal domain-containing protein n=1 Tax=Cribrihabitans marinus TaxID=1227549 RepID=A0A1H6TI07_9RHOB|nr:adenylate/guanylate cyclase domain-containing protein [Cribrihabitans marinus]GGH22313.1 putative adenylate cyclase 3 [Cribrihabitans marinus]SEI75402.1 TolB amino-terminal domain-containing protein [Cribrihabitans marinus]
MRRLVAILAADVVGYSGHMAREESATLAHLTRLRRKHFEPAMNRHRGRVVKLTGDGALAEFNSVVDAVSCAIALQTAIAEDRDMPLQLRIGINLGDIVMSGGDIYGDGVNIAARLEALAEPGGICLSGLVRESIGNRIEAEFSDDGHQALRNIESPVRVFRWPAGDDLRPRPDADAAPSGKASIAVLAFDNMSPDPEQEYFSDGIAEDIITALSHFRDFFVIARNTSFAYKGQPMRVDALCAELGVRYLLEGSVRRAGDRVRVTAQLIDGATGAHIWASRFDRVMDDIFAVQDEITQAIVGAVAPETLVAETRRARAQRPESLTAWERLLQARWHLGKYNRTDNDVARALLTEALSAEPENSDANAALALCDLLAVLHLWRTDTTDALLSARAAAEMAVGLDDQNANAHAILAMAAGFARDFDEWETSLARAIALNPNLAIGHGNLATYHGVSGQYEAAIAAYERAIALSPRDPLKAFWRGGVGIGAYIAGEYAICAENARAGLRDNPGFASLMRQETAALGMLGQMDEARASLDRLLDRMPGLTLEQVRQIVPVRHDADQERWLDGLRLAGLGN